MAQTAVEYLISLITKGEKLEITPTKCGHIIYAQDNIIEKVLAMEKEQIMHAYIDGEHQQGYEGESEQYYNETYGNEKSSK
jgi:hypothetical protein